MRRWMPLMCLTCLLAVAQPAWSDPPPADAQPLFQIIQTLEQQGDVAYFDEIEWDDDDRHWEIEYISTNGAKVEVKVDAVTGQVRN